MCNTLCVKKFYVKHTVGDEGANIGVCTANELTPNRLSSTIKAVVINFIIMAFAALKFSVYSTSRLLLLLLVVVVAEHFTSITVLLPVLPNYIGGLVLPVVACT